MIRKLRNRWRGSVWTVAGALLALSTAWGSRAAEAVTNAPAAPVAPAAAETVERTWMTFGLDRLPWLHISVLGNPLWQYLASLIYIVLAFYISKLLDYVIQVQLRKWAAKTQTRFDDLMLDLLHGPVKIISFVIFLHVGLRVFAWPAWAAIFISNGLKLIVAGSLTYVAIKFVDLLMGLWQQRVEATHEGVLDLHLFPIIRKTLKIFVLVVSVLVTSQNLGMNVTGLLASLSIGGLAVGLAAQDTLSNLFGAVAIFADKPFRVGDRIQLDSIDGTVEVIGLRSTRVRNLDGFLVTIPNKNMANANIINVSKRPNIKTVMNIGVTYDTPSQQIERAMQIINEIYRPHPKTADLLVGFNKFESSSLNILVVHWWNSTDYNEYLLGFQILNLELKRRFDAEGINFAFPSQTVYLRQDSQWRVAPAAPAAEATGSRT
ncbi:MAG TPA: mechanosensitive ion channel family protein [Verrucomicrobiae bacterium]